MLKLFTADDASLLHSIFRDFLDSLLSHLASVMSASGMNPPQDPRYMRQHQMPQGHHQQQHHPQHQQQTMLQHQQQIHHQHHQQQPPQQMHQQLQHQPQQQQMMHHSYDSRPSTSGTAGQMMAYPQQPQTSQHIQPSHHMIPQQQQQPQSVRSLHRNSLSSQLSSLNHPQMSSSSSAPPSASVMGPSPMPGPGPSSSVPHRSSAIAPHRSEPATPAALKRQREEQAMMPPPKRKFIKRDVPPSHRIHEYEKALDLTGYIRHLEALLQQPIKIPGTQVPAQPGSQRVRYSIFSIKGIYGSEEERVKEVSKFYNTKSVGPRKWLLKQMIDESDSESDGERSFTIDDIRLLLKIHKRRRSIQRGYLQNPLNAQYTYYGAGLISAEDRFPEHQAEVLRQHGHAAPGSGGSTGSQ